MLGSDWQFAVRRSTMPAGAGRADITAKSVRVTGSTPPPGPCTSSPVRAAGSPG